MRTGKSHFKITILTCIFKMHYEINNDDGEILPDWTRGHSMSQRLIRLPQVKTMVGLGTTAVYDKINKGEFPRPIKLGRSSRWVESEVQAWIFQQIQTSRETVNSLPHTQAA